ncbi:hypothetical protein SESBI_38378 [Sesbania bispinosa]|nr:hypothetical protein SESBI_38378 [Sesbania bispinosa]
MSKEKNEGEDSHCVNIDLEEPNSATKKRIRTSKSGEKEGIISSMKEVADSLKDFVEITKKKMEKEVKDAQEVVQEVLNELQNIPNLQSAFRHKAIAWLTENPNKFAILRALPLDEKDDFLLAFIS